MSSILLVEDEQHLAEGLRFNLEAEGYTITVLDNGEDAMTELHKPRHGYDLLVLDIMLPGINGFEVMEQLRQRGELIPTLMLTARGQPEDVLKGFECGADDYLPKPFELPILLARIRGLLRRLHWSKQPARVQDVYEFSGRAIDFHALELHVGSEVLQLTLMEADLLRLLIEHEGKPVSRRVMLEKVWGLREDTDTRAIDNFIVRLRKYIEPEPTSPRHLLTVRGVGYKFVALPK